MPYEILDIEDIGKPVSPNQGPKPTIGPEPKEGGLTGFAKSAAKAIGGPLVRTGEFIGSLPGQIGQAGLGLAKHIVQQTALPGREELAAAIPTYEEAQEKVPFLKNIPTPEQAREETKAATGKLFEPETPGQALYQNIATTAIDLLAGGGKSLFTQGAKHLGKQVLKAGARSALVETAPWIAKEYFQASPGTQAGIKTGAYVLSMLPGMTGKLKTAKNDAYTAFDEAVSTAKPVAARNLEGDILKLRKEVSRHGIKGLTSEKITDKLIDDLQRGITFERGVGYTYDPKQLWEFKKKVNNLSESTTPAEFASLLAKEGIELSPEMATDLMKTMKPDLQAISRTATKNVRKWAGETPDILDTFNKAEELHSVLANAEPITRFIKEKAKLKSGTALEKLMYGALYPLGKTAYMHPVGTAGVVAAGGAGLFGVEGAMDMLRFLNNPIARKEMGNIVKSAVKQDAVALGKHVTRFNKIEEKLSNKKQKYEILDASAVGL